MRVRMAVSGVSFVVFLMIPADSRPDVDAKSGENRAGDQEFQNRHPNQTFDEVSVHD